MVNMQPRVNSGKIFENTHSYKNTHIKKNTVPEGRWHGLCIIITHYRERMEGRGRPGPGGVVCMS